MDRTYKSAKAIYARFASIMKPQTADWRVNAGDWVNTGMVELGNAANLKEVAEDIIVRNHRFRLPTDAKTVRYIVCEGKRLYKQTVNSEIYYDYNYAQPNYIRTSFQEGTITLVYLTLNLDETGHPMIPHDTTGSVDEYLYYYLMRNWLISNTHPVFNYEKIDRKIEGPEGRRDLGLKFKASNALKWLTQDEMVELRDKTIGLYKDYDRFVTVDNVEDDLAVDPSFNLT